MPSSFKNGQPEEKMTLKESQGGEDRRARSRVGERASVMRGEWQKGLVANGVSATRKNLARVPWSCALGRGAGDEG